MLNHSHVLPTRKADQTIADKRRPARISSRTEPARPHDVVEADEERTDRHVFVTATIAALFTAARRGS